MDSTELRTKLFTTAKKYLKWYNKNDFHAMFIKYLVDLSEEYGYKGIKNYKINAGLINVVWVDGKGSLVLAIEVDRSRNTDSIIKLLNINADNLIWVYTGTEDLNEFLGGFGDVEVDVLIAGDKEVRIIVV